MKWINRLKLKKISTYAIIACLSLSIVFAGYTIYGDKVGNFIISVDKNAGNVNIALSEREDLTHQTARLTATGLDGQDLATLSDIPNSIAHGMGSKNDNKTLKYIAYSFYMINLTERDIDYTMDISIKDVSKKTDSAVRVMLIENDETVGTIYAKAKEFPETDAGKPEDFPYLTVPFASNSKIFEKTITDFKVGAKIKYTMVIWLEGWDNEANDSIRGGSIKMTMNFFGF